MFNFISSKKNKQKKSFQIKESELFSDLEVKKGTSLFLGKYTLRAVASVLKKKKFFKEAKKRKLWPLILEIDSSEFPPLQRFQIFHKVSKPENMVADLKLRVGLLRRDQNIDISFPSDEKRFLFLEWLTLQNPLMRFSREKIPLPGQTYPGLNMGKKIIDIFLYLAQVIKCEGIIAFPAYFHNALLFSRKFYFIDPKKQGELLSLKNFFHDISFKHAAWIVHLNCLKEKEKTFEWKAVEQALPINEEIAGYFKSKEYKEQVTACRKGLSFSIDWPEFRKKMKSLDLDLGLMEKYKSEK